MKTLLFPMLIAIYLISCEQSIPQPDQLSGTWEESSGDILVFNGNGNTFHFDRGSETINGSVLPKKGSGIYEYSQSESGLLVRSYLSSNSSFMTIYFMQSEDSLEMGSFYDLTMSRTLVFKRKK